MKKIAAILAVAASLIFASSFNASAQDDDFIYPSNVWPYLYKEFQQGTINMTNNQTASYQVNVCVDGSLHYLNEKGVIMEALMKDILTCKVGKDIYINVGRGLMQIVAGAADPIVVKVIEFDENAGTGANLGYGMTSQTVASTSIDLTTISSTYRNAVINANLSDIKTARTYGTKISLKESYSLRAGTTIIPATKSDFLELVGKDKGNAFLKANKIKWSNPESLFLVAEYIFQNK